MADEKNLIKVVLIGGSKVGKTAILNRKKSDRYSNSSSATIGFEFSTIATALGNTYQIWDTAGKQTYIAANRIIFNTASTFIWVVDGTESLAITDDIKTLIREAQQQSPAAKFYIAVNKWQEEENISDDEQIARDQLKQTASEFGIELSDQDIFFCSAKNNLNIDELFNKVEDDFIINQKKDDFIPKQKPEELAASNVTLPPKWLKGLSDTAKIWLGGNVVTLGIFSAVFFTLAAFTAGSFLTFGILPSAFIGAAIVTLAALAIWNAGCAVYKYCIEAPDNPDQDQFNRENKLEIDRTGQKTANLLPTHHSSVITRPVKEDENQIIASEVFDSEDEEDKFNPKK